MPQVMPFRDVEERKISSKLILLTKGGRPKLESL